MYDSKFNGAFNMISNTYLDIGENGCQLISNPKEKKGAILLSVLIETTKKTSNPTMVVTQKQLIKNPNMIKDIADILADSLLLKDEQNINFELENIEALVNYSGLTYISVAKGTGDNCAVKAIESLIDTLPLNNIASSLLFFQIHPDFPIMEISVAVDIIYEKTSEETPVLLSLIGNESLSTEEVRVLMMHTNFK